MAAAARTFDPMSNLATRFSLLAARPAPGIAAGAAVANVAFHHHHLHVLPAGRFTCAFLI